MFIVRSAVYTFQSQDTPWNKDCPPDFPIVASQRPIVDSQRHGADLQNHGAGPQRPISDLQCYAVDQQDHKVDLQRPFPSQQYRVSYQQCPITDLHYPDAILQRDDAAILSFLSDDLRGATQKRCPDLSWIKIPF